jgi:pimeloyl-ACP methyl ester carboxylesterase
MKVPLLFALALAACIPARAAEPSAPQNRYAASLEPAERFDVGAMLVERHGQGGRPLVLIPGLASGSWAWQDTVREFGPQHALYVVTLPGFDGRPAVEGRSFEAAGKAVLDLIESRKLDKPVLIGHSLGGTLAIALAEQRPELVGGIVAIDGLPVFPGTEEMPASQRSQSAVTIKASMPEAIRKRWRSTWPRCLCSTCALDLPASRRRCW